MKKYTKLLQKKEFYSLNEFRKLSEKYIKILDKTFIKNQIKPKIK